MYAIKLLFTAVSLHHETRQIRTKINVKAVFTTLRVTRGIGEELRAQCNL